VEWINGNLKASRESQRKSIRLMWESDNHEMLGSAE